MKAQEQRAGRIGDVGGELTRQAQPDVVLGQEHAPDPGEGLWLLFAQPQQLGRLKARQSRVAGDGDETVGPDQVRDLEALGLGPLVVPEEGGANDAVAGVEHDGSVHLPGQAHARDLAADLFAQAAECQAGRVPPVLRPLLHPARAGRQQRVLTGGLGDHRAGEVDRDRADARRADVQPDQNRHAPVLTLQVCENPGR